jgi:uncharacterized protein (DUF58 family)
MPKPADILNAVRRVEIKTTRAVNDMMVGAYHSQFKGRGMDFEELREYVPGDDVRSIDWNVTARMRRPFVKLHREERELNVMIVLDISASGEFGTSGASKREYATEIAATLAYSALRNGDKVGLLLFSSEAELFVRAKKGKRHLLRLIRDMLTLPARHRGTDIHSALIFLNHVLHRRTIIFLISDFLHSAGDATSRAGELFHEIGRTHARHDLVCVHLYDQRESVLPPAGLLTLEDAETGEILEVDTNHAPTRAKFEEKSLERRQHLDGMFAHTGVDFVRLRTGDTYAAPLQRFFEQRRR